MGSILGPLIFGNSHRPFRPSGGGQTAGATYYLEAQDTQNQFSSCTYQARQKFSACVQLSNFHRALAMQCRSMLYVPWASNYDCSHYSCISLHFFCFAGSVPRSAVKAPERALPRRRALPPCARPAQTSIALVPSYSNSYY